MSERAIYGYRSGKYRVTAKALQKLEAAERAARRRLDPDDSAESFTDPKQQDISRSAQSVREDGAIYSARGDDVGAAFKQIREGLDLLEKLMKNPPS